MIDIGGIEVVSTGSRLLTGEDVTEVTAHIERLESENAKLRELVRGLYDSIDSVFWDGEAGTRERFKPRMRELGVDG